MPKTLNSQPRAHITKGSVDVEGRTRTYTLAAPPDGNADSLLLVFHGSKQTGEKFRAFTGYSFDAPAATGNTVVAYLDGYKNQWNDARKASNFPARTENINDVAFAKAMIDLLSGSHRIDRSRVYAAGYSNGGAMVIRLIHEIPGSLAGAAILAATQPAPENFLGTGAPAAPLPVLLMHGTRDHIVPYAGGLMSWWVRLVFRVGGRALSAERTAAYFAARNKITVPAITTTLPHDKKSGKTSVTRTDFRQDGKPPVVLYSVHGGGHTIPGPAKAPFVLGATSHDVNTADVLGEFFGLTSPRTRQ